MLQNCSIVDIYNYKNFSAIASSILAVFYYAIFFSFLYFYVTLPYFYVDAAIDYQASLSNCFVNELASYASNESTINS